MRNTEDAHLGRSEEAGRSGRRTAIIAVLVATLAVGGGAAAASSVPDGPVRASGAGAGTQRITQMTALEARVLGAINRLRRQHGLARLRPSGALAASAEEHSRSMAERGYFAHDPMGGALLSSPAGDGGYRAVGENIAWASPALSAGATVRLWLRSPAHRAILLAPGWLEIGVGAVHASAAGGVYAGLPVTIATARFGSRS
jgi:uncharacterized protein YkwD